MYCAQPATPKCNLAGLRRWQLSDVGTNRGNHGDKGMTSEAYKITVTVPHLIAMSKNPATVEHARWTVAHLVREHGALYADLAKLIREAMK